ncbi:MAG: hypothetical protein A2Z75_07820 [Chloroflexi bacterium RBG_13_50_10]|nr:MAG: hypothetical protein A2Z75_07820 [Chloroflexi bacterium RBG_13_50_10]
MHRLLMVLLLVSLIAGQAGIGATAYFTDAELNTNNTFLAWVSSQWVQTTQAHFNATVLSNVDTSSSPGNVKLSATTGAVTDTFTDESKIASKANLVVTGGQVKLTVGTSSNETLRPNASGNETSVSSQYPSSAAHWDKMDEPSADDFVTYVATTSLTYQRDLYGIPVHTLGSGTINKVTVYFRLANSAGNGTIYAIAYTGPDSDGFLKTVEIANGQITDAVVDTLEFDPVQGNDPNMIWVSGNIYAIAYRGDRDDGFLKTVEITPDGQITDTVISTFEFDTFDGWSPNIIRAASGIYAIAYRGKGGTGFLTTVQIAANGQITGTAIDTLEFDTLSAATPSITLVSGNVYAVAYWGSAGRGYLKTVEIATNGQITDTVIDTLQFDTVMGYYPNIVRVSGNVYAIAYEGIYGRGYLKTVEIATNGQITDSIIDTLELDAAASLAPNIIHISGDIFAVAYPGESDDGYLKTVEIATNGQITDTVIDTMEFDTTNGLDPNIIPISGNVYAIAYQGVTSLGYLKTVEIAANGQITDAIIDILQFDSSYGAQTSIIPLSYTLGNVWGRAVLKTHGVVYNGTEESTSNAAFVTKSYQWTQNPNTNAAWTWAEIDALQIGIELKTASSRDSAACTQVYVVVEYLSGYSSAGTLTSTNLVSGIAGASIDSFAYSASGILSETTLKVQFSQDNTSWYNSLGTPGGWDTLSQGTNTVNLSALGWAGSNFYYKANLTSDGANTPVLDDITVNYSTYVNSGTLASQILDTTIAVAKWDALFWDETLPSNADITFEVRASDTLFAENATTPNWIDLGLANSPITSGLPSGQYMQWRATLTTSDTSKTPTLHEVTVEYY